MAAAKRISMTSDDKEELDNAAKDYVKVKERIKALEEELKGKGQTLIEIMEKFSEQSVMLKGATVSKRLHVKYAVPTPDEVRSEIGTKLAAQFIKEVVSPEFRTAIPPGRAASLCPEIERTEYLSVSFRKGDE